MLSHVIDGHSAQGATLIDQIYRLRYRVFKDRMGWEVEYLHGREIDQFDTAEAVYGAVTDPFGEMEGCFRLLPTTGPYMLRDVFPELLHGRPPPCDEHVLESSRFAVLPSPNRDGTLSALYAVAAELLRLQLTYCLDHDVHTVVSVTDLRFERVLLKAGLRCERFGPPLQVGKTRAVAGFMHPTEENLLSVTSALETLRARPAAAELVPDGALRGAATSAFA